MWRIKRVKLNQRKDNDVWNVILDNTKKDIVKSNTKELFLKEYFKYLVWSVQNNGATDQNV